MVDLHRLSIEVRLESIEGVGKGRKFVGHVVIVVRIAV